VLLHFADWVNPGIRIFDILIEGQTVVSGLDVSAVSGLARNTFKSVTAVVSDGVLDVAFRRKRTFPLLCGIEVLPRSKAYYESYRKQAIAVSKGETPIQKGIEFFRDEVRAFPDRPEGHHLLGELFFRKGQFVEAAESFGMALNRDPGRVGSQISRGYALQKSGKFQEAFEVYKKVLEFTGELPFHFWASLGAASRNVLPREDVQRFFDSVKARRRQDSPAWDFAAFFKEQLPLTPSVRIHCGGERITTPEGTVFEHDRAYKGGRLWYTDSPQVTGIYKTARWTTRGEGQLPYAIPVPRGRFVVTLHFIELVEFRRDPGKRLFDVVIEGQKCLEHFDIAREVGFRKPIIKTFEVDVVDGLLEIDLVGVTDGPIVSGIEITPVKSV